VERILKMAQKDYQFARKVLEINPDSTLIRELVRIHNARPEAPLLKDLALQLLDNMLLREGIAEDIESVVSRLHNIMQQAARTVRAPAKKKPAKAKG
jgi:molecular chaperone HtpG